jgi:catechol 2,3-dioxygenase-like lactoylglutathione lyase family enzyme
MEIVGFDHVQLAMPAGEEPSAIAFYGGLLGLTHVPKPEPLASRGGCWFEGATVKVHLGVEADFRPARKAHPALIVRDLDALVASLERAGVEVRTGDEVDGRMQRFVDDPFGNRIELVPA